MITDIRSFLLGYFYTAKVTWDLKRHFFKDEYDMVSHQDKYDAPLIPTKSGKKLMFVINRGISPIGGRVKYAFENPDDSTFDIWHEWCDKEVWAYIEKKFPEPAKEYKEVRVSFDELIDIIENT